MTHAFVTIAIPFGVERANAVDALLDAMGNPPTDGPRAALDATGIVHFMSLTALRDTSPGRAHLVLEASADLGAADPIKAIATALGPELDALLEAADVRPAVYRTLPSFLAAQSLTLGAGWGKTIGIGFDGSPGLSVRRVLAEQALAARISATMPDVLEAAMPARDKLRVVRERLWQAGEKWAFAPEAVPFLFGGVARTPIIVAKLAAIVAGQLLWPALVIPVALMALFGVWSGLHTGLALLIVAAVSGVIHLRRMEVANPPDDTAPNAARLAEVERRENHGAQNLLAACSVVQAGWFRRLMLRVAFGLAAQGVARVFRPGFLRQIAVIHFARWVLIPGTNKLLFYSNFSDTWESYLEDFISKAGDGLTAIWSNTLGFPRTKFLFEGGAADGDRFRRWARRQQIPVRFWYSAYPGLKTQRMRLNAAIRYGIAAARTDAEAEDWLTAFGGAPRPPFELQKPEIQTLVFGALKRLRFSAGMVLTLGPDPRSAGAWLQGLEADISYGELGSQHRAMTIAFTATGLTKLGLAADDLASFPVAFQHGMTAPWRSRLLGDAGAQSPETWLWGAGATTDALIYVFAADPEGLAAAMGQVRAGATGHGHRVAFEQVLKPLPQHGPVFEPFGYADGVSQPVLRDTPRARVARNAEHVVDAGEFVLGYPDSRGYCPPSPVVGPGRDPARLLPEVIADLGGVREPFSSGGSALRDLGRNGSFMVVRQLEQDPVGLDAWLAAAAARLEETGQNVWSLPLPELKDLLGAKMVGRWKDGTSLVRHADAPKGQPGVHGAPDNDFKFAREDPQGLRCPLGAHMRRANPRDSLDADGPTQLAIANRHRLMRVGRQYEAPAGGRPGLMFTCLNADIERQFEFVQQSWLLGENFHGLPNETDPALGAGARVFTIPTRQGPVVLTGLADFVRVRGGAYFFMPSRSAISYLARVAS